MTASDPPIQVANGKRPGQPVWLLVLLAPLVAEFVSGNLPVTLLWLLVVYAPLYGGAALLIREASRRSLRPWPVVALLGLAYGVAEEAFLSGSLFNPTYAELRLLDFGWIPALGIGAWWTVFVVVLHLVWSIWVPIVLAESVAGDIAERPWLRRQGLLVAALTTLFGAAAVAGLSLAEEGMTASVTQLVTAALVVIALCLAAVAVGRRGPTPGGTDDVDRTPPSLLALVGAGATVGLVFLAGAAQQGPVAVTLGIYAVLLASAPLLLRRWARRPGWGSAQRLALATGVLIPHVGFALLWPPLLDVPVWISVASDTVFTLATAGFLLVAWRRQLTPKCDPQTLTVLSSRSPPSRGTASC